MKTNKQTKTSKEGGNNRKKILRFKTFPLARRNANSTTVSMNRANCKTEIKTNTSKESLLA